jgi:hypothetical protein
VLDLTLAQQTELEKGYVSVVYFVELEFAGGFFRFCSSNRHYDWGGHTWVGAGNLGAISEVKETESLEVSALDFSLNLANPSVLAASLLPAEDYRGKPARMFMCPVLDSNLVDTPVLCWSGTMDTMGLTLGAEEGSISLRCLPYTQRMNRPSNLRLNHETHKRQYPTERGFEYLNDLIAKDYTWASRKFQLSQT